MKFCAIDGCSASYSIVIRRKAPHVLVGAVVAGVDESHEEPSLACRRMQKGCRCIPASPARRLPAAAGAPAGAAQSARGVGCVGHRRKAQQARLDRIQSLGCWPHPGPGPVSARRIEEELRSRSLSPGPHHARPQALRAQERSGSTVPRPPACGSPCSQPTFAFES